MVNTKNQGNLCSRCSNWSHPRKTSPELLCPRTGDKISLVLPVQLWQSWTNRWAERFSSLNTWKGKGCQSSTRRWMRDAEGCSTARAPPLQGDSSLWFCPTVQLQILLLCPVSSVWETEFLGSHCLFAYEHFTAISSTLGPRAIAPVQLFHGLFFSFSLCLHQH